MKTLLERSGSKQILSRSPNESVQHFFPTWLNIFCWNFHSSLRHRWWLPIRLKKLFQLSWIPISVPDWLKGVQIMTEFEDLKWISGSKPKCSFSGPQPSESVPSCPKWWITSCLVEKCTITPAERSKSRIETQIHFSSPQPTHTFSKLLKTIRKWFSLGEKIDL